MRVKFKQNMYIEFDYASHGHLAIVTHHHAHTFNMDQHEIAMDEASSVDEDAILHQKIEVENDVCLFLFYFNQVSNFW